MTPEKQARIEELAEGAERAKMRYEGMGMMNMAGLSEGDRIQRAQEYAVARTAYRESMKELDGEVEKS